MRLRPLLEADARLSTRLRIAEQPGPLRSLAALLAHSGDSWFWGLGLALIWWQGPADWKAWAVRVFGSIAALAALVLAIKLAVRRRRPEGEWGAIYRSTDPHSFPSGHAARAALLAVLAAGWGPAWLAAVILPWAPLVAVSRVAMGLHYLSDVVAGAVLGLLAGGLAILVLG
jgi:undecaprenyl-diphosphatase